MGWFFSPIKKPTQEHLSGFLAGQQGDVGLFTFEEGFQLIGTTWMTQFT